MTPRTDPTRTQGRWYTQLLTKITALTVLSLVLFAASRTVRADMEKLNAWMHGNP